MAYAEDSMMSTLNKCIVFVERREYCLSRAGGSATKGEPGDVLNGLPGKLLGY